MQGGECVKPHHYNCQAGCAVEKLLNLTFFFYLTQILILQMHSFLQIKIFQKHLARLQPKSMHDVHDLLKALDTSKATGPDGISPKLLHEAGITIVPSLTKLINLSLSKAEKQVYHRVRYWGLFCFFDIY